MFFLYLAVWGKVLKNERMKKIDEDKIWVEQAQRGERAAFDKLFGKYKQRLVHHIQRYSHDAQDAMDILQETWIRAYRAIPNFHGDSIFYTWIYRIASNTAKKYLKRKKSFDARLVEIESIDREHIEQNQWIDEKSSPEDLVISDETEQKIATLIIHLPEYLRAALLLREIAGLSYKEIAVVLKCPVGTVRSRISRARTIIQENLKTRKI